MHAFWLVLTYDLLEDRRIDNIIIKTFLNSLLYKTNRFQVGIYLLISYWIVLIVVHMVFGLNFFQMVCYLYSGVPE